MAVVDNQTSYTGTPDGDSITGTDGADTLYGADGNDTIQGLGGNDLLYGEGGNDIISGGAGSDTLVGGDGSDALDGGSSTDDYISYRTSADPVSVYLPGTSTGYSIEKDGSRDYLINIEAVRGSEFGDTLVGSDITGVTERYQGLGGNDTIDGKGGSDRLENYSAFAGVYVNLNAGTLRDYQDQINGTSADLAFVGIDTFTNIEQVIGSRFGDYLTAAGFGITADAVNKTSSRDTYNLLGGGRGDDTIEGNGNTQITYDFYENNAGVVVDYQTGS